jgi:protein-tyrosine kinase
LERAEAFGHEPVKPITGAADAPATAAAGAPWEFETDELAIASPPSPDIAQAPRAPVNVDSAELPLKIEEGTPEVLYHFANAIQEKLVVGAKAEANLVEQYRRLAATLHHAQRQSGDRTVMIASAVEAEGKTLTATNLALTLSHSYQRRVLLIDADLRRPAIHDLFQLDNRIGLGDILRKASVGRLPVHKVSPTLWVMTAGRPVPDPMSGLVSETMKQILTEAVEQFDWVVVDTPPVALLPDANLLAAMIDLALIVVRANSTPYPLVQRAIEAIGTSRVLGVVLNRTERSELAGGYGYNSYGYSYNTQARTEKPRKLFRFPFRRRR